MRPIALILALGLAMIAVPDSADAAELPDVVWRSVEGQQVVVQKEDGWTLTGTLQAFDDTTAVLILPDGSVLAIERTAVASIKLADASAPDPVPAPAPAAAPAPAPAETPERLVAPAPAAAAQPGPQPMPAEIQARLASLTSEADGLRRGEMATGLPGILMFATGGVGMIVHASLYDTATSRVSRGNADDDDYATVVNAPRHIGGFGALFAGGGALVIASAVFDRAAKNKLREITALQGQYAAAGIVDVNVTFAVAPESAFFELSGRF